MEALEAKYGTVESIAESVPRTNSLETSQVVPESVRNRESLQNKITSLQQRKANLERQKQSLSHSPEVVDFSLSAFNQVLKSGNRLSI